MKEVKDKVYHAVIAFGVILLLLLAFLLHGCKLTTTSVYENIERKEVPPYIENVMTELCDSCRIESVNNLERETVYVIRCKKGAILLRKFILKQ